MRRIGFVGLFTLGLGACASQQGSQVMQVADESLTCQQLRAAITDAKAAEANADARRGGNAVGGIVDGLLIPGAVGNQVAANQFAANQAFDDAKAREDKLTVIYRQKKCGPG
jgi:hypothetical protein